MQSNRFTLCIFIMLIATSLLSAQIPQTISYQGVLTDNSGAAQNGNFNFQFRIFLTASGGTALWTESHANMAVDGGIFNVILGSSNPLGVLEFNQPYYLEISVDGNLLSPRIAFTSAAYSLFAQSVADSAITSAKLRNNAVTATKIADNAVTSAKIASSAVGTAALSNNAVTTPKIKDGAVTQAKLEPGLSLPPGGTAGGDLTGTFPNPTVSGLRGRLVDATAPTTGQVLKWDGSNWAPQADGLSLPYYGITDSGISGIGITHTATSGLIYGGYFSTASTDGRGVYGLASAESGLNYGGYFLTASTGGRGVYGTASANSGSNYGGYFESHSSGGRGVLGRALAESGSNCGGYFDTYSPEGTGVYGVAWAESGSNYGGYFQTSSTSGRTVYATATATSGFNYGGYFQTSSTSGRGVFGSVIAASGINYGGYFQNASTSGRGVYGEAYATSGTNYGGVFASHSGSGTGVFGNATATSGANYGGYFQTASTSGRGVYGSATATSGTNYGGYFETASTSGRGVYASANATSGTTYGVRGYSPSSDGYGVYSSGRFAATGSKSFQIDHPLDPGNKYLNHYCTEGAEPLNAYSGNIVTDAQGYATVNLPDYFETINRDFRYQLTVIDDGDDFVLSKITREIQNNLFIIRTSKPEVKVSWRVEAVRNDPWVARHGAFVEQEKPIEHRGKYLHPELYGMPRELGVDYHPDHEQIRPVEPNHMEHPEPPSMERQSDQRIRQQEN